MIEFASSTIRTIAGNGACNVADGAGTLASLYYPSSIWVSSSADVYFIDAGYCKVRKVSSSGIVSTIGGTSCGYTPATVTPSSGVAVSSAYFWRPQAICGRGNNFYIATQTEQLLLRVNIPSGIMTRSAGFGFTLPYSRTDGIAATSITFNNLDGCYANLQGDVMMMESNNAVVWKIVSPTSTQPLLV